MAKNNRSYNRIEKRKKNKKRSNFIERFIVVFSLGILVYLSYGTYVNTKETKAVEVFAQYGSIEQVITGKAKIIRNEIVLVSETDGDIEYYYHEGEKVKNASTICKIYEKQLSNDLEKKLNEIDKSILKNQTKRQDLMYYEDELNNIDEYIMGLIDEYLTYSKTQYSFDVYTLKDEVEGKMDTKRGILASEDNQYTRSQATEREDYTSILTGNTKYVKAPIGGVISYYIDGHEDLFTPNKIKMLTESYLKLNQTKLITSNKKNTVRNKEAVAKIVDNSEWFITALLDKEKTAEWVEGESKDIRVKNVNNSNVKGTIYNILEDTRYNVVTFRIDQQLNQFMAFRDIEIEVIGKRVQGIKIPNTSIVTKQLIGVPKDYIGKSQDKYYVTRIDESNQRKTQVVSIVLTDSEYSYIEPIEGKVSVSTNIYSTILGEEYRLSHVKDAVGTYVILGDVLAFKAVTVKGSNEEDTIIEAEEVNGIKVYDKIRLDNTK